MKYITCQHVYGLNPDGMESLLMNHCRTSVTRAAIYLVIGACLMYCSSKRLSESATGHSVCGQTPRADKSKNTIWCNDVSSHAVVSAETFYHKSVSIHSCLYRVNINEDRGDVQQLLSVLAHIMLLIRGMS